MFCKNCGKQLNDDAKFCTSCGQKVETFTPQPQQIAQQQPVPQYVGANAGAVVANVKTQQKNKIVGMVAVGIVVIIIAVLLFSIFGGKSPESSAKKLSKAFMDTDAKTIVSLIHKDVIAEALEQEGYDDDDLNDFIDDGEKELESTLEGISYWYNVDMDDIKKCFSFEYDKADKLDDEDLEYLEDYYDDNYDLKVKDACSITITAKFEHDDFKFDTEVDCCFVKIDGKWYLDLYYSDIDQFL